METHFFRTTSLGEPERFEPRLTKAEQIESLDGAFTLELTAAGAVDVSKGDHLIYRDDAGLTRDVIVVSPAVTHDSGGLVTSIVCKDRIAVDAADLYIEDQRNTAPTRLDAIMGKLLKDTPYSYAGEKAKTVAISFYHKDLWSCLCAISKATGLELYRSYATDSEGHSNEKLITAASVGFVTQLAAPDANAEPRRFDYGYDVTGVTRTINADSVVTCMYGYGKGLETDQGGFSRKLTVGSVNGGKNYVTVSDAAYARKWGIPDPIHNTIRYRVGTYENSDCADANQLLRETKAALDAASKPSISYELDTLTLDPTGMYGPVRLGETVQVVDSRLGLHLTARVSKRVTDLLSRRSTITLGVQSESFTTQAQGATSSATASATAAVAAAQGAVATQADIAPTVERVKDSGDGWDKGSALADVITLSNGLPEIVYDGKKYSFDPETGTFKEA